MTSSRPSRVRDVVRPVLQRWLMDLVLVVYGLLGIVPVVLVLVTLPLAWVGLVIPLWFGSVLLLRGYAGVYRRWAGGVLGISIPRPYRPMPRGLLRRFPALLTDPATWRDLGAVAIGFNLGVTLALLRVGLVVAVIGVWVNPPLRIAQARLTAWLLVPTENALLAQRVAELAETRAQAVDAQAAELRRIERDLHDGAQARLVALAMTLGMAEELLPSDPDAVAGLLTEAKASATAALAELRDLVRGIHPPVLADRGLDGAVRALALAHPLPVRVDIAVPERPSLPVESAAYFAVAEVLANVAKHGCATEAWVRVDLVDDMLSLVIGDNGGGGARLCEGGGLQGVQRRLAAFDGTIAVVSPAGGPTVVTMIVPVEPGVSSDTMANRPPAGTMDS